MRWFCRETIAMIGSPAVREAPDSRRSLRRSAASTRLPAAISAAKAAMATCMSRIRDCLQFRFTKRVLMHVSSDLLTLRIITLFGRTCQFAGTCAIGKRLVPAYRDDLLI